MFEDIVPTALGVFAGAKVLAASVQAGVQAITAADRFVRSLMRSVEEKAADDMRPIAGCNLAKEQRVRFRAEAIRNADERLSNDTSMTPAERGELQAATDRFKRNNRAVEYAKLSDSVYEATNPERDPDHPKHDPAQKLYETPEGWSEVKGKELEELGLTEEDLTPPPPSTFGASVYRNGFGMQPPYVIVYRGTEVRAGQGDITVDIRNATGQKTDSYRRAMDVATKVQTRKPGQFAVAGHSLGGGLAQAAGAVIDPPPPGYMFNSAGAHPDVVGSETSGDSYSQFRSKCDPLSAVSGMPDDRGLSDFIQGGLRGVQGALSAVYSKVGWMVPRASPESMEKEVSIVETLLEVSGSYDEVSKNKDKHGWYIPPNKGKMSTVYNYDNDGNEVPCESLADQHSIGNLVNGMEREKRVDMLVMEKYGCDSKKAI